MGGEEPRRILEDRQVSQAAGEQAGHPRANADHERHRRERASDAQRGEQRIGQGRDERHEMSVAVGPSEQGDGVREKRNVEGSQQGRRAQQEHGAQGHARAAERVRAGGHLHVDVAVVVRMGASSVRRSSRVTCACRLCGMVSQARAAT